MRRVLIATALLVTLAACSTGKDAVIQGQGTFQFTAPGGQTHIDYTDQQRQPLKEMTGDSLLEDGKQVKLSDYTGKIVVTPARPELSPGTVRTDGTYIVTGGLGALGLEVARSLVARGARHVALIGRRAANEDAAAVLAAEIAEAILLRANASLSHRVDVF